ncbi:hypothetical protein A2X44_02615 [candidate division CPR3 bacterium GWF2_35_18]|uniref:Uncharacterized protein n=1 Tax=candidate division CPR3 bacterium GW2011_GWF2_35_18 TaxID=1618350 RepID=A0A0G0EPP4_UNCC3|nr:MAG: hypothetical protein UR67_C0008G0013 [candidate division CPR3 bacterium GW2011_GWF2_35_18]KKP87102.1 MAG: hypothetical protein UR87_C0004G0002 [candidate division CPR3 bacterium GW2011_GWE2_35_7]OGB62485.1 MAG: hypothetical protein A2X44_02615 [candidate division CPR3 bacterium GWF2_35_18]OGB65529.1 MAG: hypothetical protein A2250_04195 [candidate division CPR3 bacterium RIFOXYA2_FULL_35_13]OGB79436.1 MAG: hypothetical protein A2296_03410 [candidate division CPR3 bacterium RIFOXYB2_FULL
MDNFDQNQNNNSSQVTDNPVPHDQTQNQSFVTPSSDVEIESQPVFPKVESSEQNISDPPIIKKGYGDNYEENEGVKEIPVSHLTTEQVIFEDTKNYPQAQPKNQEINEDNKVQKAIDKLAAEAIKEPIIQKPAEVASVEIKEVSTQRIPTNMESEIASQSSVPPITTAVDNQGVSMANDQFVEKLDLEPNAQQVFEEAASSDNPEQVFDAVEQSKDEKLAQELIQKSGLSPEIVQKALQEKTQKIQEEQSSVPPRPISEVTTQEAKAVLGEEEYQKEAQDLQSINQPSSDNNSNS